MYKISDKNIKELQPLEKSLELQGKKVFFRTGKLANLINGSIEIFDDQGNLLLVTAGIKEEGINEEASFFPLVVDYQERYYATGKIGGNRFMKREGRPSESAILLSRLIDRPIRPMFPKGMVNDTQIIATVLSSDDNKELGTWGITGASMSLLLAGAPIESAVSGVKIALKQDGELVYDPSFDQEDQAEATIIVAGTKDAILMVEATANEIPEEKMLEVLDFAHNQIIELCDFQEQFLEEFMANYPYRKITPFIQNKAADYEGEIQAMISTSDLESLYETGKKEFQTSLTNITNSIKSKLEEKFPETDFGFAGEVIYSIVKDYMRSQVLENDRRLDGRGLDEIRHISAQTGLLPRAHGSGLFNRGLTQVLSVVTLGGPEDDLVIDGMQEETTQHYMHHYNFPPYSVGEVRMLRGVSRREVGHGKLAERALLSVLPDREVFPYAIRVVSETLTCNGSSSMASVCGSTLALMNAGVPISSPVSAVAMGMIYDENTKTHKILTDIQAQEDFLGDMDFKISWTNKGITAMQLDMKVKGLARDIFAEAFTKSKVACESIREEMLAVQSEVASELSPYAPLILTTKIDTSKIREIIGKGGENVQRMEANYDVKIHIDDDGLVTITGKNIQSGEKVINDIKESLWKPEVGLKIQGQVVKILDGVGALVKFKSATGMLHVSKLSDKKIEKIEDVIKEGELVDVEVIRIDEKKGRIELKKI